MIVPPPLMLEIPGSYIHSAYTCGEAKVPFEPKSDRPVYCSECFAKMRENG